MSNQVGRTNPPGTLPPGGVREFEVLTGVCDDRNLDAQPEVAAAQVRAVAPQADPLGRNPDWIALHHAQKPLAHRSDAEDGMEQSAKKRRLDETLQRDGSGGTI